MHLRMRRFLRIIVLVSSVAAAASCRHAAPHGSGSAHLVVRVDVRTATSAAAIGTAIVELYDQQSHDVVASTRTDSAGQARLVAPSGRGYQLRVRQLAYVAVSQALPTAEGCVMAATRLELNPCDLVPDCARRPSRVTFNVCRAET